MTTNWNNDIQFIEHKPCPQHTMLQNFKSGWLSVQFPYTCLIQSSDKILIDIHVSWVGCKDAMQLILTVYAISEIIVWMLWCDKTWLIWCWCEVGCFGECYSSSMVVVCGGESYCALWHGGNLWWRKLFVLSDMVVVCGGERYCSLWLYDHTYISPLEHRFWNY